MPNIIITGASEGIGAELARQLARRHGLQAMLVLAARNANTLQSVSAECKALGARTLILPTDVTDPAQCQHLVDTTVRECGGLDILINNAGVSAHANFEDVPADKLAWYEQLMRVNLWGSIYCTHAAMPHLKQTQGRIVALSSLAGLVGIPGRTAYCASKFALVAISRTLQQELNGTGVFCSVICPGVAQTGFQLNAPNEKYPRAAALSSCTSAQVADAVIDAMQRRRMGEVIVPWHSTLLMRFGAAFPGVARAIMNMIG